MYTNAILGWFSSPLHIQVWLSSAESPGGWSKSLESEFRMISSAHQLGSWENVVANIARYIVLGKIEVNSCTSVYLIDLR